MQKVTFDSPGGIHARLFPCDLQTLDNIRQRLQAIEPRGKVSVADTLVYLLGIFCDLDRMGLIGKDMRLCQDLAMGDEK